MSTDVKHMFSHGGLTVSKMCHSLSDKSTCAATVLGTWCDLPCIIPWDDIMTAFKDKSKWPKVGNPSTANPVTTDALIEVFFFFFLASILVPLWYRTICSTLSVSTISFPFIFPFLNCFDEWHSPLNPMRTVMHSVWVCMRLVCLELVVGARPLILATAETHVEICAGVGIGVGGEVLLAILSIRPSIFLSDCPSTLSTPPSLPPLAFHAPSYLFLYPFTLVLMGLPVPTLQGVWLFSLLLLPLYFLSSFYSLFSNCFVASM